MNFAEMRSMLLLYLDDPRGSIYNDEQLRLLLNNSLNYNWSRLMESRIYLKQAEITLEFTANTQTVDIEPPTEASLKWKTPQIAKCLFVKDTDGVYFPIYEEAKAVQSKHPCFYVKETRERVARGIRAGVTDYQLGYYVIPTSSMTVYVVVNLTIDNFPENAGDESELYSNDIPPEYHNVVVLYARLLAAGPKGISREQIANVQYWQNMYNAEFMSMLEAIGIRDDQDAVVDTDDVEDYA